MQSFAAIADLTPSRLALASADIRPQATRRSLPQAPVAIHLEQPVYPSQALDRGLEGQVVVEFGLNADGSVRDPVVVDTTHSSVFDQAAIRALLHWRFAGPAAGDVGDRYRQTFTFTLHPSGRALTGREVEAKPGCYEITGSHICRTREPEGQLF
jgi:TonB family protein